MSFGDRRSTNNIDKTNLLNNYFYSVFLHDQHNYHCPSNNDCCLHDIEISTQEIFDIMTFYPLWMSLRQLVLMVLALESYATVPHLC